ncbi:hypothetical protein GOP47_0012532 [Adiantum capillus-veneris]|uniref:DNA repair protein UVH3 n=1 Tax=Adiantum capillus-veneris TaxID=13818 RepID=A0A9D4UR36_ADICA|nr:hypothetical protein GOP47_0012532 [Adiantum capillus-veneris]
MGVQGLWELLAPVGRRVSVEALSGRKLAIDASIWIIQFMKAMRDDKGDMIRHAHLLGFFRRICKLLYLRAKPVFVFDGGTPALKRRTVIARRRQREQAQSKIRKTAEKLLLNHLQTRKLDEIAQNIGLSQSGGKPGEASSGLPQLSKKRGKAKAGTAQEVRGQQQSARSKGKDKEETSMVENLIMRQSPLVPPEPPMPHENGKSTDPSSTQEGGEHVTADNDTINNASDGTDDDNEEYFMLPPTQGRIDPAVLASLPPSMQLNLLVQMREQLVTDNRKRFQKVAKNPASFSQMQIQAYLKTVAFRRDINEVQRAAAGKGIGGIPSARIASEVDREYIFSTSFHPEKKAAEVHNAEIHEESRVGQDNLDASQSSPLWEGSPEEGDIQRGMAKPERISLQELTNPEKVLDANENVEDNDIVWEDGIECVVPASSQPVKGGVITIEIDQDDLLAEGIEVQNLRPDVISESEEIEWEDDASPVDSINIDVVKNAPAMVAECEVGTNVLTSTGVDSPETVDRSLMEIEAAELEEAIRQSLQGTKGFKEPKLIIRDGLTIKLNEREVPPSDSIVIESSLSEEDYLARERERKGKAIVGDSQAVFLEHSVSEKNKMPTQERSDFIGVLDRNDDNWKPSMSEGKFTSLSKGLTLHANGDIIQAHATSSTTADSSVASKIDIVALSKGRLGEEAHFTIKQTTNPELSESDSVVKLEAGISAEALSKAELRTDETSICCVMSNSEQDGAVLEDKQQAAYTLQASVDTPDIVGTSTDAVMEHEKVPSSLIGHFNGDEDEQLPEDLLKEAEKVDLIAEREAFAKRERDLLAEREELLQQQAELQAVMEAEQSTMQVNLQEERDYLLQEEMDLRATQRKNERNAESVSGEMFSECQELLQMFGLPYIIAPMEAEAQCAYMDSVGLVDGVVTDDCDVFLFGGRNVFKNIFDDRKYVETYYMKDVESELGLDQEKLILMALLLGSDYTEGISGIGIVNAIEVVNAFEGEEGLQKFKEWLDAPDFTLLGKIGQKKQTRKKKVDRENEAEDTQADEEPSDTAQGGSTYNLQQQGFMNRHRAVSKNWNVPESFPNPMVINAYRSPQVDKSSEAFMWGRPDLEALRRLCLERFGWNKSKSDELLVPVLKEHDRHETQLRLEAFYSFNQRFAKIRSKRIQKAVSRGTGRLSSELVDFPKADDFQEASPIEGETNDPNDKHELDHKLMPSMKAAAKRAAGSKGRKMKASQAEQTQGVAIRGRGRGRGGIKSTSGRAKASNRSDLRLSAEASLSDRSSSEDISALDQTKRMDEVDSAVRRRSNRLPQRAIYNFSGSEEDMEDGQLEKLKAGGSPDCVNRIAPSDVNGAEESSVFSSSKVLEAERNGDRGETGVTSVEGQYGWQKQGDGDHLILGGGFCAPDADNGSIEEAPCRPLELLDDSYLVMGGGFCAVDAEDGSIQQQSFDSQELHTVEGGVSVNNDFNITAMESVGSDSPFVGEKKLLNSERAGPSSELEPSFRAVPLLRRKKRRIS